MQTTTARFVGFAVALAFTVSRYVMNIKWEFDPLSASLGVLATAAVVMFVGVASSFDVLFRRPLVTLRSQ